jgi:hypothetical protein
MVLACQFHQYIGAKYMVAPLFFYNFCSTNILLQYKENQNVSSTTPIRLNVAYSIGWSGAETETNVFEMAANFKIKRILITAMRAKNRAFAIFPTPLVSHWSLPTTFSVEGRLRYNIR